MPPTNLLLVFADQMRGQAMGCAGDRQLRTANLDRLAAQGVRFRRACCNSPVCTPSRGSMLTGLYPHRHGACANDLALRTDVPSLGTLLRDAGYATGYIGKWHLDGVPRDKFTPPGPRRSGFDTFWAVHNCTHAYLDAFHYRDHPERVPSPGYEPEYQTGLALDFLRRHRRDPFCLVLSWGTPHDPYRKMPDCYLSQYDPATITLRPNVPAEVAEATRQDLAGYYGHILAIDEYLGRIMTVLEELSLADRTLVVFTSDHGDMLGSHGLIRKQKPWEESINVPLLLRQPGRVPAGRVSDELFGLVDLTPTLLSLVGLRPEADFQGLDLSASVIGSGRGRDEVLIHNPICVDDGRLQPPWWGLRTPRWTYARTLEDTWVLFDHERDPYQMTNLAGRLEMAGLERELAARLETVLAAAGESIRPWPEILRDLNLIDAWNARELELHGRHPENMRRLRPDGRLETR